MEPAEQIVRKLDECIVIMKSGKFTEFELKFISIGLNKMLEVTERVLKRVAED